MVKGKYTYEDKNDDFEREPFVVHFHVPSAGLNIYLKNYDYEKLTILSSARICLRELVASNRAN